MSRVTLIVVFNHRYEQNLERLRQLYAGRFDRVLFLMPFYRGSAPDVIPVYESSYSFNGFFTQARHIIAAEPSDYYLFAADDLLINPRLNQDNLAEKLHLTPDSAFIKKLEAVNFYGLRWQHLLPTVERFAASPYIQFEQEIPSYDEAIARFQKHGVSIPDLSWNDFRFFDRGALTQAHQRPMFIKALRFIQRHRKTWRKLPYPLVMAYSDFFVLPASAMPAFMHVSGVFASMNLFVEIAIPTALLLTCDQIVTEADTALKGKEFWSQAELDNFLVPLEHRLERILAAYDDTMLYIHPIKFSKLT
jgi:hypothetical protein